MSKEKIIIEKKICRECGHELSEPFLDLGKTPLANALLTQNQLSEPEMIFPLRVYFCSSCLLVQAEQFSIPEDIFSDYVYFSSWSDSWLKHCANHSKAMIKKLKLDNSSFVVEIASNDGYLLKNFVEREIPCLGIEPAENVAKVAVKGGVPTEVTFFGKQAALSLAERKGQADLIIANNVMAHVPDLNDFINGFSALLKPGGVITIEFPHLLNLLNDAQFDTIYHEHFSYFSLLSAECALERAGLQVFDVDELPTHGGSLRLYVQHESSASHPLSNSVLDLRMKEIEAGLGGPDAYVGLADRAKSIKLDFLEFLITANRDGKTVAAYGAAAKGNTLLNYCGVHNDLINFVVDRNPEKQGKYLPGSQIPVLAPEALSEHKPDYVVILPWNLKDEIMDSMQNVREWGGHFVVAIPETVTLP